MRSDVAPGAKEPSVSRRWRQAIFPAVIIVGLRVILGEWNWWLTVIGAVIGAAWILLGSMWRPGERRNGTDTEERS
jgi:hypothetical protein